MPQAWKWYPTPPNTNNFEYVFNVRLRYLFLNSQCVSPTLHPGRSWRGEIDTALSVVNQVRIALLTPMLSHVSLLILLKWRLLHLFIVFHVCTSFCRIFSRIFSPYFFFRTLFPVLFSRNISPVLFQKSRRLKSNVLNYQLVVFLVHVVIAQFMFLAE